jgi:hypothetical protein
LDDEELAKSLFTDADGEKVKRLLDAPASNLDSKSAGVKLPPSLKPLKPKPLISLGIKRKNETAAFVLAKAVKTSKGKKPLIDYPSSEEDD